MSAEQVYHHTNQVVINELSSLTPAAINKQLTKLFSKYLHIAKRASEAYDVKLETGASAFPDSTYEYEYTISAGSDEDKLKHIRDLFETLKPHHNAVIDAIPEDRVDTFKTPMEEGFNKLSIYLEACKSITESSQLESSLSK